MNNDASKVLAGIRHEDNCNVNRRPPFKCDCGHGTRGNYPGSTFAVAAESLSARYAETFLKRRRPSDFEGDWHVWPTPRSVELAAKALHDGLAKALHDGFVGPHNEGMAEFFKKPLDV